MKIIHAACSGLSIRACGRSTTFARARVAGAPVRSTERLEFGGAPPVVNISKRSDSKFIARCSFLSAVCHKETY